MRDESRANVGGWVDSLNGAGIMVAWARELREAADAQPVPGVWVPAFALLVLSAAEQPAALIGACAEVLQGAGRHHAR